MARHDGHDERGAGARRAPRPRQQGAEAEARAEGEGHRRRRPAQDRGQAVEDVLALRPLGPRRAGVRGLGEQDRDPRQIEQRGQPVGQGGIAQHRAAVGAGPPHRDERRDRPHAEEQPPVVGVGEQRERDREGGQPGAPALDEDDGEGRRHHRREQGDEGVHPRLLRVVGQEGIERRQHRGDPGGAVAEQGARAQPRGGHGQQREGDRQPVRLGLAAAEHAHPQLEQQVVQRRRSVLAQDAGDG